MTRLRAACVAAIIVTVASCNAQDTPEEGLLFHLSFDSRDVAAEYAGGSPQSTTFTESLELRGVEGIHEFGFQIAEDERLDYDLTDNFHLPRGTASMWIKPVNWKGRNDRFEVFLDIRSPQHLWRLYKYSQPNHLFCYLSHDGEKAIARTSVEDWRPGEWHHIAAAWSGEFIRLYLDGDLKHEKTIEPPMELPDVNEGSIIVTPPKLWEKGFDPSDRTVVDEVKIWDRVLDDAEIRRIYLTHAPEDADTEPLDVQWEIDPTAGAVMVEADAFRLMEDGGEGLQIRATLEGEDGAQIAQANAQTRDGAASFALEFGELTAGEYTLTVTALHADGTEKGSISDSFERPRVTWEDAPTFDGMVPEPWTPIQREGNALRVWGRAHSFGGGPLPTAVTSQERDVLTGPTRLLVNSEEPAWSEGEVLSEAADAVVREGSGAADDVAIDWRTRMEFDGMLRCDLTVKPVGERADIASLALELPVRRECGGYVLAPVMEEWDGDRIAMGWRDMVWLTGHEAGICWFAESDANWVSGEDDTPIVIEQRKDATTLTLTMIGEPVTIDGPVRYTFGLQSTPVRPLPDDWRNLNLGNPNQVQGSRTTLVAQGGGCFKRNGYLVPAEHVDMDEVMTRWAQWGRPLPYSTPTFLADHTALWDFYKRAWRNSERHTFVGYRAHDGTEYAIQAVCPRSDFSEVMVHWVDELLADYPEIGGVYYDCCSATECRNAEHGCGGVDAFGQPYATHPIFDLRDVLRRVTTIAHQHGDIVMNHAHSRFYPPIHAFSDYWFPGEQYTTRLGEDLWYYTDQIPPEVWQIELNAQVRGVGISFLPEFGRGTDEKYRREDPGPSRALLAACMVHDVPCSGHWIHPEAVQEVWEIYDHYWLSDANFYGYWEADCPVSVTPPLKASAYLTEDMTVTVVANLTPEPAEGTLRIDGEKRQVTVGARDYVVIETERE